MKKVKIDQLMETSGVKFGTSGARGLAVSMTDEVCYAYTAAFLKHLKSQNRMNDKMSVAVGGDLRPSTKRIMTAAGRAISDLGYEVINCGELPSPALANFGLVKKIPTVMVTGSHIPDDRNGIKYNTADGEIMKTDEEGIKAQTIEIPEIFDADGMLAEACELPPKASQACDIYIKRYIDFFGDSCLSGKKIGLYQHSSVGRDVMYSVLAGLGAEVTKLGFSDKFIPVDTEAIRPEDVQLALQWAGENQFDAIVSADGDADRPLISDESGNWLRGDVAGILCAASLGADAVVTPVSCNSAVEKCGKFKKVIRTRIGSPFVIEGMRNATKEGFACVVGYEANGGFLLNTPAVIGGKTLQPLATRDALTPIICILALSIKEQKTVSQLQADLPQRFTCSNRLKEFPTDKSKTKIIELTDNAQAIENAFGEISGKVASMDTTDGLRITFENSEVIHLRPSGNAPEFRCYNEADSAQRAAQMNEQCIAIMDRWR